MLDLKILDIIVMIVQTLGLVLQLEDITEDIKLPLLVVQPTTLQYTHQMESVKQVRTM